MTVIGKNEDETKVLKPQISQIKSIGNIVIKRINYIRGTYLGQ